MSMFRITVDPGAVLPVDASDPTTALAYVEQGEATFQVDAEITVLHASTDQETTGAEFEPMPPRPSSRCWWATRLCSLGILGVRSATTVPNQWCCLSPSWSRGHF